MGFRLPEIAGLGVVAGGVGSCRWRKLATCSRRHTVESGFAALRPDDRFDLRQGKWSSLVVTCPGAGGASGK